MIWRPGLGLEGIESDSVRLTIARDDSPLSHVSGVPETSKNREDRRKKVAVVRNDILEAEESGSTGQLRGRYIAYSVDPLSCLN